MRLTEVTAVPDAVLPVAALADHLRLGSGFALPADQEVLLASQLRAALAAIETRTGKALLERRFRLVLDAWGDGETQTLPVAPVARVASVMVVDAGDTGTVLAPNRWWLLQDSQRPRLRSHGGWPVVPQGGHVEVQFDAGFGPLWADLPPDLRQAVMLLAAEYYEHRHADGVAAAGLPHRVAQLIEGWRQIRILGGGRR